MLKTLKKHRAAIGYTLDDLTGFSPTLCQHKIKLDEGSKPVRDHQRRLNPKMKEVVRNEIPTNKARWYSWFRPAYVILLFGLFLI